jgi:hypothetical protein
MESLQMEEKNQFFQKDRQKKRGVKFFELGVGWCDRFDDNGGSVGEDLGGTAHEHTCAEAHSEDGVGLDLDGLFGHAVDGLFAAFAHELCVIADLAAHKVTKGGHDIASNMAGADGIASHKTKHFDDAMIGEAFCGCNQDLMSKTCDSTALGTQDRGCFSLHGASSQEVEGASWSESSWLLVDLVVRIILVMT